MKTFKKIITSSSLLLLALTSNAFALEGDNCPSKQVLWGKWAFNRQYTMADGCVVQVTPIDKTGLVYREYVFDEFGRMYIFNSVDGPFETSTSHQTYFLLPAKNMPTMEKEGETMVITLANGSKAVFSPNSSFLQAMSNDVEYVEDQMVDLAPGGHFQIKKFNGILLNAGWALGERAYRNRGGFSMYTKTGANPCLLPNLLVFGYIDAFTGEEYYQPKLKYPEATYLDRFLRAKCEFGLDESEIDYYESF